MGNFFDRYDLKPVLPQEAKYSVEKVEVLLDTFGMLRLRIMDPRLKVLISKITWNGIPYLMAISGGSPNGEQLSRMMTSLQMLTDALEGYITVQDDPARYDDQEGGARGQMAKGYAAVDAFWSQMSSRNSAASNLGQYESLTEYLIQVNDTSH